MQRVVWGPGENTSGYPILPSVAGREGIPVLWLSLPGTGETVPLTQFIEQALKVLPVQFGLLRSRCRRLLFLRLLPFIRRNCDPEL